MSRKGQAAMEFLMTYGWAILAAIIAIGVLAYFGVFSPGKYVSGTAIVNAPFYANAWKVSAASGITLELRNNGGETVNVSSAAITNCLGTTNFVPQYQVNASQIVSFTLACNPSLSQGNAFKGDITVSYRKVGSGVDLQSTGSIAEKVVA